MQQLNLFPPDTEQQPTIKPKRINSHIPKSERNYADFVEKFKPKLTTDDCFTPPAIYNTVLEWVYENCSIPTGATIVRPFRPGGNYQAEDYSGNVAVVDNPPFSILSSIIRWYCQRNIPFFLFAPYLTLFSAARNERITRIVSKATIVYHNGAEVTTQLLALITDKDLIIRQLSEEIGRLKQQIVHLMAQKKATPSRST